MTLVQRIVGSILFASTAATALTPAAAQEPVRPPNIVVILADDLGWGDLGVYGHPVIRTPRLDAMSREGIRLTSFYVAPSCSPSRAALLTGRYPIRTGVNHALGPDELTGLPPSEITLAEALKAAGYRTALVGKWHLGTQPGTLPMDQGFDQYFGLLYSNDMIRPWVQTDRPLELYRDRQAIEHPVDQSLLTERYTEEAVRFITESRDRPFFLYVAHSMPHVPLAVSSRFVNWSDGGLYGDVVESIDWSTGRILDALRDAGLEGNTLVIFTSDNGPWIDMPDRMFGGDVIKRWDAGTAGPFRGSKATTYEGGVRVPFIARWPGRIPADRVSSEMLSSLDLFPTILRLVGVDQPNDRDIDGFDVMNVLTDGGPSPREIFHYFNGPRLEAIREGRWKLRVTAAAGAAAPQVELFDLRDDPFERFDQSVSRAAITSRLTELLITFARETGAGTAFDSDRP